MKKIVAVLLALLIVGMLPVTAFAADQSKSTKLTTSVPGASYTLNIPASQEIAYGANYASIGNVTVTESAGFSLEKNLKVTMTYDDFVSENPAVKTTIPYELQFNYGIGSGVCGYDSLASGSSIIFYGRSDGQVSERALRNESATDYYLRIDVGITGEAWNSAKAGNYSSTITFSAEVVSSESA